MSQEQRVRGQQDAQCFFRPLFCRGKGRMEDKKDWIGCGEVGRDRGKTRLGGGEYASPQTGACWDKACVGGWRRLRSIVAG